MEISSLLSLWMQSFLIRIAIVIINIAVFIIVYHCLRHNNWNLFTHRLSLCVNNDLIQQGIWRHEQLWLPARISELFSPDKVPMWVGIPVTFFRYLVVENLPAPVVLFLFSLMFVVSIFNTIFNILLAKSIISNKKNELRALIWDRNLKRFLNQSLLSHRIIVSMRR